MSLKEEYKIGVGVITTGMRTISPLIERWTTYDLYISKDTERKGPAHARNDVLKHFQGYDFVFILDDDVIPRTSGWEDFFIKQAIKYNVDWMGFPVPFSDSLIESEGTMGYWHELYGPMQFFTKKAMETLGGYNQNLHKYGWEDLGLMRRAKRAGLCGNREKYYAFPVQGLAYLHPLDYYPDYSEKHYTGEEKSKFIAENADAFWKEFNGEQVYYPLD